MSIFQSFNTPHHRTSLLLFGAGIVVAVLFLLIPGLHDTLLRIDRLGYLGMFIAGILYSSAFTSATATVLLTQDAVSLNPIFVGLIGALGAMSYDAAVFLSAREGSHHGRMFQLMEQIRLHFHIPSHVSLMVGGLILASPLPDELAAGFLGAMSGRIVPFLVLSFACNAIGIMLLSLL
ncbi:MAG: hypothetical protein WCV86_01625 [Patescibacteria group bacterium]|jgi:hypothetical protein